MIPRNVHIGKLHSYYLFAEIARRRDALAPTALERSIISLGIGDTTLPIPEQVSLGLSEAALALGEASGYSGYESSQGHLELREAISKRYYDGGIDPDDIFISDGSKPDIGRLQWLFVAGTTVAVQDPSYPAYIDSSVVAGRSGPYNVEKQCYDGIVLMPCTPENGFFPDLDSLPHADVLFFCSPNNPTGVVATHEQLERLVEYAKARGSLVVFDSAYSSFVTDDTLPRSIFEIPGGQEVALETGSFSKSVGFTGVRLGWTVVPKTLRYSGGGSVRDDWERVGSIFFNGTSVISQKGGLAALSDEGIAASSRLTSYYLSNATLLRDFFVSTGLRCFGGIHAPYLWVEFPGRSSWDVFDELLKDAQLVTTPGVGFGPSGEGFVRFSAFCNRDDLEEAIRRMTELSLVDLCH